MPLVSVIIPTYNHQNYVLKTLDSVFAQTCTDYEVIVVNDGSPDRSDELLRPLVDAGCIRYILQANQGQAAARNRGIAEARGKYIALLDDDDCWPTDKLEWQVRALQDDPEAILVYGSAIIGATQESGVLPPSQDATRLSLGSPPSGWVHQEFLHRNWMWSPGQALIRSEAMRRIGGFDAAIWGTDDHDLFIRLAARGRFIYHDRPALHYRVHAGNMTGNSAGMYRNACKVRVKHLGRLPSPRNYRVWLANYRFCRDHFARDNRLRGWQCLRAGNYRAARSYYEFAIRLQPMWLLNLGVVRDLLSLWKRSVWRRGPRSAD